jgi:hypothetical protein
MNWKNPKLVAGKLRDQALADILVAQRFLSVSEEFYKIGPDRIIHTHASVAKYQQCCEKLLKGYYLWHNHGFDPTKGHKPLSNSLAGGPIESYVHDLLIRLNRVNRLLVDEIRWLESLAPGINIPIGEDLSKPLSLSLIPVNTEYPFWSNVTESLVIPAAILTFREHGNRAMKVAINLCRALDNSEPSEYTKPIQQFREQHRLTWSAKGS